MGLVPGNGTGGVSVPCFLSILGPAGGTERAQRASVPEARVVKLVLGSPASWNRSPSNFEITYLQSLIVINTYSLERIILFAQNDDVDELTQDCLKQFLTPQIRWSETLELTAHSNILLNT